MPVVTKRTNLAQDPGFENFLASQSANYFVTSDPDTTVKYNGTKSVRIAATAAVVGALWYTFAPTPNQNLAAPNYVGIPAVAGTYVLVKVKVRLAAAATRPINAALQMNWYGTGAIQIGPLVVLVPGQWIDVALWIAVSTDIGALAIIGGIGYGQLYLVGNDLDVSTVMNMDAEDIEGISAADYASKTLVPYQYFDGSSPTTEDAFNSWTGTPNASTSVQYGTPGSFAYGAKVPAVVPIEYADPKAGGQGFEW